MEQQETFLEKLKKKAGQNKVVAFLIIGSAVLTTILTLIINTDKVWQIFNPKTHTPQVKTIIGQVQDSYYPHKPVKHAEISIATEESKQFTDDDGQFFIRTSGTGSKILQFYIYHEAYLNAQKNIEIDFSTGSAEIVLDEPIRIKRTSTQNANQPLEDLQEDLQIYLHETNK